MVVPDPARDAGQARPKALQESRGSPSSQLGVVVREPPGWESSSVKTNTPLGN